MICFLCYTGYVSTEYTWVLVHATYYLATLALATMRRHTAIPICHRLYIYSLFYFGDSKTIIKTHFCRYR